MDRAQLKWQLLLAAYRWPGLLRALSVLRPVERDALRRPDRWEREYREGGWDWLWSAKEALHHHVIAAHCLPLAGNGSILDVGCGEGVLHAALRGVGYGRYAGIDLSETAIARASRFADERTHFTVADAETFDTAERFDLIILNESLYLLGNPPAVLGHLAGLLRPNGAFIISMAMGTMSDGLLMLRLWRDFERDFSERDEIVLLRAGGPLRIIKVLQPRAAISA